MPRRVIYHVMPAPDGWQVRRGRAGRASAVHTSKPAALRTAGRLAKAHPHAQVIIHNADGTIAGDRTYDGQALRKKRRQRKRVKKMLRTKARNVAKRRSAGRRGAATRKRRQRRVAVARSRAAKRGAARRRR